MAARRQKSWARRRRLGAAAKKTTQTKHQTRARKQMIRHVARRHGGH